MITDGRLRADDDSAIAEVVSQVLLGVTRSIMDSRCGLNYVSVALQNKFP